MKKIFFLVIFILSFTTNNISVALPRCSWKEIDPNTQPCKYNELWQTIYEDTALTAISLDESEFSEYIHKLMEEKPYTDYIQEIMTGILGEEEISDAKREIIVNSAFDYDPQKNEGYNSIPYYFADEHILINTYHHYPYFAFQYYGNALAKMASKDRINRDFFIGFIIENSISEENIPYYEEWFTYLLEQNPYDVIISIKKYLKDKNITKNPTGEKFLKDFYHKALKKY